jgi:uncharacterized protein Veg
MYRSDLLQIKKGIESYVGTKVRLESNKGRHKLTIKEGIISHAYPSIFTVKMAEGESAERTLSFSYTDILTNTVEITLFPNNK